MVSIGSLRESITITKMGDGLNDLGEPDGAAASTFVRSANIKETSGREQLFNGVLADQVIATVRVRSDSDTRTVTSADSLSFRGKSWAIKNIMQLGNQNRFLEIVCECEVVT